VRRASAARHWRGLVPEKGREKARLNTIQPGFKKTQEDYATRKNKAA
jgi:hypothetical protein